MTKLQITEIIKMHHPNLSGRQYEMYIELAADRIAEETDITKKTFTLNSVAGQSSVYIWFYSRTGSSFRSDVCLDDVTVIGEV